MLRELTPITPTTTRKTLHPSGISCDATILQSAPLHSSLKAKEDDAHNVGLQIHPEKALICTQTPTNVPMVAVTPR